MSNKHDYTIAISGHEVLVEHPGGIRTWEHPGRDSQLARVTAILTRDPDCVVVHDQEMDVSSGSTERRRVRQVLLHATRDPAATPLLHPRRGGEARGIEGCVIILSKEQIEAATGLFDRMNTKELVVDHAVFVMFGLLLGAVKAQACAGAEPVEREPCPGCGTDCIRAAALCAQIKACPLHQFDDAPTRLTEWLSELRRIAGLDEDFAPPKGHEILPGEVLQVAMQVAAETGPTDSNGRLARVLARFIASAAPAATPEIPWTPDPSTDPFNKAKDAYDELGKAFDTGAFAPPEGAAAWKARAARAITEIAEHLGLQNNLESSASALLGFLEGMLSESWQKPSDQKLRHMLDDLRKATKP